MRQSACVAHPAAPDGPSHPQFRDESAAPPASTEEDLNVKTTYHGLAQIRLQMPK